MVYMALNQQFLLFSMLVSLSIPSYDKHSRKELILS